MKLYLKELKSGSFAFEILLESTHRPSIDDPTGTKVSTQNIHESISLHT